MYIVVGKTYYSSHCDSEVLRLVFYTGNYPSKDLSDALVFHNKESAEKVCNEKNEVKNRVYEWQVIDNLDKGFIFKVSQIK